MPESLRHLSDRSYRENCHRILRQPSSCRHVTRENDAVPRANHLVLTEFSVPSGDEWNTSAESWLLVRVVSGVGYWKNEESVYREMSPEDVLLVFPGAKGTFLASRIGDVQLQTIAIDLGLLYGVLTVPECRALSAFAERNQQKAMYLPRAHPFSVKFSELCRVQRGNAFMSRLKLLQLFAELIDEELQQAAVVEPMLTDSRARMRQLIQQIPEAVLMRCSVPELAEKLYCSQRHFSRLFREEFGVSLREKQTKLRLERARHLLETSPEKIINIALDAGYQSLSLFNVMFKERFKMTPSQWRSRVQASKVARRRPNTVKAVTPPMIPILVLFFCLLSRCFAAENPATASGAANARPAAAKTNASPRFSVRDYRVLGNTLLSTNAMHQILAPYTGDSVDLESIKKARAELLLAYRERGYATVAVNLPQQKITNGLVYLQVSEGKLAEVLVVNNRYFSSNNVMRSLPSLTTGAVLNSKILQAELDASNANRDRQIYPQIHPGPDPGTSSLLLKVQDRLPLHGRVEMSNYKTPDSPGIRINTAAQYNNLWQREHSAGFQYGFTPEQYKAPSPERPGMFPDRPLIAYYNGFYRMPLMGARSVEEQVASRPEAFGYNEATRQFAVPPVSQVPELFVFANRSTTDSSVRSTRHDMVASNSVTVIESWEDNRSLSTTESAGFRINWPLLQSRVRGGLSFGFDLRHYESVNYNTNIFSTSSIIPGPSTNDPPETVTTLTPNGRDGRRSAVTYLPAVLRAEFSMQDPWGVTSLGGGGTYNLPLDGLSDKSHFSGLTGSSQSSVGFAVFNASLTRDQKIVGDWRCVLRAEGQFSTQPVFSNEQFALGGISSVRGYMQGESFGDAGLRLGFEPRTPSISVGKIGTSPVSVRFNTFLDYGRTYLLEPMGRDQNSTLIGFGSGMNWTIGRTFDISGSVAWPKKTTHFTDRNRSPRFYFSASAQF